MDIVSSKDETLDLLEGQLLAHIAKIVNVQTLYYQIEFKTTTWQPGFILEVQRHQVPISTLPSSTD